jgi:iron(II)-dependent oxidoreductase
MSLLHREIAADVEDARRRTLELVSDLTDEQLFGPRLSIVNPLRWEAGHVAWFQERWVLRHALSRSPLHQKGDALYDSSTVPHDTRWDLPLLSRQATSLYLTEVRQRVLQAFAAGALEGEKEYFVRLSIAHEDMHDEAFLITRQTLGYPAPELTELASAKSSGKPVKPGRSAPDQAHFPEPRRKDAQLPGGTFLLGAVSGAEPFIHDNEKWAHPVEVEPFAIAKMAVTQSEFAEFVGSGGYQNREYWSDEGWSWRASANAEQPVYWRKSDGGWERRHFDRWVALEPKQPMIHVNWYEVQAYCRFAGRRLPSEVEWEVAASSTSNGQGSLSPGKRRFPWGEEPPTPELANLDARRLGCAEVDEFRAGDSAFGCRQMVGNVWEWTDTVFLPYPGFSADPYRDYSEPWFGTHRVLRGGCWATRARLIRNTWRNFYTPDRRDIFAGFRTCAL